MQYTDTYRSPLGIILLACDGECLTGLWFEGQTYFASTLDPEHRAERLPILAQTELWLDRYFAGEAPECLPPLRPHGTPFRLAVWDVLRQIPYGTVMTYGQIASQLAQTQGLNTVSARAVGGAVGHNPISILIPCHRVVGSQGSLTGYAGGLDRKLRLLTLEGAR